MAVLGLGWDQFLAPHSKPRRFLGMRLESCKPWFLGPQFLSWGCGKPSIGTSFGQAQTHLTPHAWSQATLREAVHGRWMGW